MKRIAYLILFLLLADCAAAQNGYRITTLPSQYLFRDYNITVERKISNFTIGGTLAYRPAKRKAPNNSGRADGLILDIGTGASDNYLTGPMINRFNNGYTIGANAKYYPKSLNNTLFFEFFPFYRHWGFKDKQVTYFRYSDIGYSGRRTESMDIYGFKLFLGTSIGWRERNGLQFLFDTHIGVGWRLKTYYFETEDGYVYKYLNTYSDEPYIRERGNVNNFTFHFGMRFGVGWNDRAKQTEE